MERVMEDLSEQELHDLTAGPLIPVVQRLVAEVLRRRAADPKPEPGESKISAAVGTGKAHLSARRFR